MIGVGPRWLGALLWRGLVGSSFLAGVGVTPVVAQEPPAQEPRAEAVTWRVVTKDSPPFAFEDAGRWRGLGIEIGREIARELGVVMEVRAVDSVEGMLQALEQGDADAALAAVTVTAAREKRVDFSHPYYKAGLGVAVRVSDSGVIPGVLRAITSPAFLQLMGLVILSLIVTGLLFWWVERRSNPQFGEVSRREGVGFGFWWSTIILFGHKGIFPKTITGRVLAAMGMLVSVLLLSVLTGAIASILTVSQLEQSIRDVGDLRHVRTVTVAGTASEDFLQRNLLPHRTVASVRAGLQAVEQKEADAMVFDAPILSSVVRSSFATSLQVLDRTFEEQDYAVAFPLGSPWRKRVNQAILAIRSSREWQELLYRYLGR